MLSTNGVSRVISARDQLLTDPLLVRNFYVQTWHSQSLHEEVQPKCLLVCLAEVILRKSRGNGSLPCRTIAE